MGHAHKCTWQAISSMFCEREYPGVSVLLYCKLYSLRPPRIEDAPTREANRAVKLLLAVANESTKKKRKVYTVFTDQQRAEIRKYDTECGILEPVHKDKSRNIQFGREHGVPFQEMLLGTAAMVPNTVITSITSKKCGCPLALGVINGDVWRKSCTAVNSPVIVTASDRCSDLT